MKTIEKAINLSQKERDSLLAISRKGENKSRAIMHANVLLMLDESGKNHGTPIQAAKAFGISKQTVNNIKQEYLANGLEKAVVRKKRQTPPVTSKITGDVEAKIITIACSERPEGCGRWTLRLIKEKTIELKIIDSISHEAVSRLLKKHNLSLT